MKRSPINGWLSRNPKESKPSASLQKPSGVRHNPSGSPERNHKQALQAARAAWGKTAGKSQGASSSQGPAVKPEQKPNKTDIAGPETEAPSKVAKSGKWRVKRRMLLWSALLLFLAGTSFIGLFALWVRGLDISKLEHPLPEPSFVMDAGEQPVSQLSSSRIIPVPLAEIPADLKNAVIAVEDRRFYEHAGFDLWSIGRALIRDLQSGSLKEGGSTITQQLAKNLFLDSDKTLSRKVKELGYAIKINFAYSKDEILELYLNSIYYGEGRWGVEGAARQYFGKPVKELTLAESALLAGLPKAPTLYSPVKNPDKALERRNLVLSLMLEQGTIDEATYAQTVNQPIALKPDNGESLKGRYPSFVDYVMDEAERLYGFTEQQILTLGLRIHTTMDVKVQQAAEEVYRTDALFPAGPGDRPVQSGVVVLDHRTGGIRAIVGARGDQVYRGFNRATKLKRQPGSTFKPLAVYGPALERGYTPDSLLYDGRLDIGGYRPSNWDGQTRGQVTLREAVLRSWNIPPVWLLNEIGIDAGLDYVRRAGIDLPEKDRNLSLALGGLSAGVSPLQMAQAYGAIANQGVMERAHAITRITTKDGHPLVEAVQQRTMLTAPVHAYTMTQLLQEAVAVGTGQAAALLDGRPTAGKTGTTQLPDTPEFARIGGNGAKDAWFVGFTPELTAAIWLGYDKTDQNHYLTTSGGAVPAVLFREIMTRALKDVPVTPFPVPDEVLAAQQAQLQAKPSKRQNMYRDEEDRKPKREERRAKEERKDRKSDD
ncbi:transglycosylase domain-containing protein [Paenibacillus naphthalenovorans]|uniref:transglycosylase domain-containing protein n=1 Tax=Paenibacillus naphthalenovorans TaxID=162209 RepID=UPI003D2930E7